MRMLPAVALATLLLAGCVPTPSPTPTPEPSATPVFASEEEALAAAEEAYGNYQAAVDRALTTLDPSGLDEVAVDPALASAVASVNNFIAQGRHQTGESQVVVVELVQSGGLLNGLQDDLMQVYACLDIADVHVFDQAGTQIDPVDRRDLYPMVVDLMWMDETGLLVENAEVWDGDDFCAS